MAEVASAFVSLMPSAKGFGKSTERQIGPQMTGVAKRTGSRFGKVFAYSSMSPLKAIGAAAIGLFAVKQIKDFFGSAISEARESQKVSAITAQVIKSTGGAAQISAGQVGRLATAISNKTGIDDEAIQAGANLVLTFKNIGNEAGAGNDIFNQTTQIMTDMATAMGNEPKAAAIQLGKALNDPVKGITALTRVGVSFTEEQKKQIATLVESGNTLGAQKIILKELKSEFGGTAAAAATSGEKMKTAFANFQEAIGTQLLPYIDRAENAATRLIITLTNGAGPALARFKTLVAPVTAALSGFTSQINTLIHDNLQPFFAFLSGLGGATIASFSALIGSTLVSALELLVGALVSPVAIVGFLGGAAIYAYRNFAQFRTTVDGLALSFQTNVLPKMQAFGQWVIAVGVPAVITFGQAVATRLLPILTQLADIFTTQVIPAAQQFATFVSTQVAPIIASTAQQVGTNLVPVLSQLATTFQTRVLPSLKQFLAAFRQNQPAIQQVVLSIVKLTAVLLVVGTTIASKVLPPTLRLEGALLQALTPAIVGTIVAASRMVTVMALLANVMLQPAKAVKQLSSAVIKAFGAVLSFIKAVPAKVAAALSTLFAIGSHAGSELGRGVITGLLSKAASIASAAASVAGAIKDHFPGSPVKTGPLKSWNNGGAGKRLVQMLADGIIAGTPGAVSAAVGMATKVEKSVLDRLTSMRDGVKSILDGLKSDFASLRDSVASTFTNGLFDAAPIKAKLPEFKLPDNFADLMPDQKAYWLDLKRQYQAAFMTPAQSASDVFIKNLLGTRGQLRKLNAAFKQLVKWGLDPAFLSQLFQSGNGGLILDLAGGSKADARRADQLFGQVGTLSTRLGTNVAQEQLGPRIDRTNQRLEQIRKAIERLPKHFGEEINKGAASTKRGQKTP